MTESNRLDMILDTHRSAILGPGIKWSSCKTRLSIVWSPKIKRFIRVATAIGILLLVSGASLLTISLMRGGQDGVFILSVTLGAIGLVTAQMGLLYGLDYTNAILDFRRQCLIYGKRRIPFRKVARIGVRRNTRNERLRGCVVEHVPDKRLLNVSVIIHVSAFKKYNFGVFDSTDLAVRFARELAILMRLDEDIVVDGGRKLPGVCYREEKLIGAEFINRIVTCEMFSKLLYSLDPTHSNCAQLDLNPDSDEVFNTALLWKGGYHINQKGKELYIPNSIVFFDIDDLVPTSKECCFISQVHGQLEVRIIKDSNWSSWLDALDKSEPLPNESVFLKKVECSFLAMIREAEKRGIALQSHRRKHYIPFKYIDAWVAVAGFCDWTFEDCEKLRKYLSNKKLESVDVFSILKLIEDYCARNCPERILFVYFDGSSSAADIIEKLRVILPSRLDVVHSLVGEYFQDIESPADCERAISICDFFLHKYRCQITKVKTGNNEGRWCFMHRQSNAKVLKKTLATCFSI